jgi:hypothetical protein
MKKIIAFYVLFMIFSLDTYCSEIVKSQRNYGDSLNVLVQKISFKKSISNELLLYCLPINSGEYLKFIELDYKKDSALSRIFRKINELWVKKCALKRKDFLQRYFEYSKFVDGYFAEDYFVNINKIYISIGDSTFFCDVLKECSEEKIKRLKLYIEEKGYCSFKSSLE